MPNPTRVRRATLTAQIEESLRSDIIEGVLAPGQRLTAGDLTDRYDVSPTPLREALQALAAQNLVDVDPRFGARVARISRAHLRDTYRIRELLESLAVRESVRDGDPAWESALREAFGRFEAAVGRSQGATHPVLAWSQAHKAFHDALMAACESQWLKSMLGVINSHSERYRMLAAQTDVRDPIAEHSAIFAAAVARHDGATVEALRLHLTRTVDVIESSQAWVDDDLDAAEERAPEPRSGRRSHRHLDTA